MIAWVRDAFDDDATARVQPARSREVSADLVYFTGPTDLSTADRAQLVARSIGIVDGDVERLVIDDDQLHGVQMSDGSIVRRDALFVPPRFVPNNDLLVGLGCELEADGWVIADNAGRTSAGGVWVAGNVADPRAQVITAAGAGSAAAIAISADLVEADIREALRDFNRGSGPHG